MGAAQAAARQRSAALRLELSEELAAQRSGEAAAWHRWSSELQAQRMEQETARAELREVRGELRAVREEVAGGLRTSKTEGFDAFGAVLDSVSALSSAF